MKILVDAMGGDNAPDAVIKGSVKAAKEVDAEIWKKSRKRLLFAWKNHLFMEHIVLRYEKYCKSCRGAQRAPQVAKPFFMQKIFTILHNYDIINV